jgi:uncharacterized protein
LRVAVLSDTHIPTRASGIPGRVYEIVAESDLVIHAGDVVEMDVIRDLERLAPVKAVLGNMDGDDMAGMLPTVLETEVGGFRVAVSHGSGAPWGLPERILSGLKTRPYLLIYGHSHTWHWEKRDGVWFLNPGSTCGSKGSRTMAVLTLEPGTEPSVQKVHV